MTSNLSRPATFVGRRRTGLPRALLAAGAHCVLSTLGCAPTYSPPSYARLDTIVETPVVVGKDWPLQGNVTCPGKPGTYPGLVLVGGSGPVDRDASIGPNKPFRDIALGLASRGICVLRYDKRKAAHRARILADVENLTIVDDTIDDALLAIHLLGEHPNVDRRAVFVAGHSLGGYAMPRIADAAKTPCGFILMAGTIRPLAEIFVPQARRMALVDGEISDEEAAAIADLEAAVQRVSQLQPGSVVDRKLLPGRLPVAYWLDLKAHPNSSYLESFSRAVLVLQGERDLNVGADEAPEWRRQLAGRAPVTLESYPTLNHLFMVSDGKTGTKENLRPGNVAPAVIDDMAQWIHAQSEPCRAHRGEDGHRE
jgi:dienelactone hydrolase